MNRRKLSIALAAALSVATPALALAAEPAAQAEAPVTQNPSSLRAPCPTRPRVST